MDRNSPGPPMPGPTSRLRRPTLARRGGVWNGFGRGVAMGEREERDERVARIRAAFEESAATQRATLSGYAGAIAAAAERAIECFRAGHRLLAFGNGGSAA